MSGALETFSTSEYEEILNLPYHIVVAISADGKFLKTNHTQKPVLGWSPQETLGFSIDQFIHPEDIQSTTDQIKNLLAGERSSIELRNRCLCKDGSYRWIAWTGLAKDGQVLAMGSDATKKVEIENALMAQTIAQKEFQTRFTTFFEQSTLPMEIYSLTGEPLAVNKAWEDLFQTTRDQLQGYNVLEDPHVKGSPLWTYLERAYKGDSVEVPAFHYDPALLGKPGRARWLEAWISPVKDESDNIREIAMILKDVTDKIETERALVESITERKAAEEKFQIISDRLGLAVRAGKIGIWEWIPNTNYVFWDETTEMIYGFKPGQFPQTTDAYTRCIHPDDRDECWSTIASALIEKKSYQMDFRIIRRDGAHRWLQGSGMALYDNQGKAYHMMGTVIDITERKEAEADQKFLSQASELLNTSLNYREILKTLCDHAISYFCDGAFIDQLMPDGNMKRLMVVHPDPEVVQHIHRLDDRFPSRYENNPLMNPLITGKPFFMEDVDQFWDSLRISHGEEYYQAVKQINGKSSIRVRLKGRESVLGMITFFTTKESPRVLTRRHLWLAEELAYRASMAFENALIHLASQEAIKARDEFLSIASHELKTPLQSLTLQNQMRKRNIDKKINESYSPEKVSQMIDADLKHLQRINRLIDDMLDISRIRAGKLTFIKENTEFNSLVKDVLDRFRPQVEAVGCYLTCKLTSPIQIEIDIYRIEQVIVNLLTNAMKYGAGKPIRVDVLNKGDRVQLQVHDQGSGIKEDDLERIFERFERAISSNEVSGLGLGLYISRQIVEQNDGNLFVRSTYGQGSTFIMELPL